jgi:energy-coupling factor transport system permease protein
MRARISYAFLDLFICLRREGKIAAIDLCRTLFWVRFFILGGNMDSVFRKCNVITTSLFCAVLTVIIFSTDNPVILLGIFMINLAVFSVTGSWYKLLKGFRMFIPFSFVTILINMIFVYEGRITLFYILGKRFTLESLIYASILSFKLLLIIYVFMILELMIDSDRAASYFSAKIPKTTLMMMIALKLFPNMKQRMSSLKDVYYLRGVNFNADGLWEKVKSNIPIMSILLENSLDGAFDIGEAAYVRGFLSKRRTIYDKQTLAAIDFIILGESIVYLMAFLYVKLRGMAEFQIYYGAGQVTAFNQGVIILAGLNLVIITTLLMYSFKESRERVSDEGQ